jgi:ABC-type transporter MlaC component
MIALVVSSFASAAEGPQGVVESIFTQAAVPMVATDTASQEGINAHVDFAALAKAALGKTPASPAEQAWFRDTLKEIITRTVYPKAPEFLAGVKITYAQVEEKGSVATVKSSVQNKADVTDVNYKLAKGTAGAWKVTDVSIAGLSWVDSIRDQVRDTVRTKKWKGLKDAMNRRLNELRSGKNG